MADINGEMNVEKVKNELRSGCDSRRHVNGSTSGLKSDF